MQLRNTPARRNSLAAANEKPIVNTQSPIAPRRRTLTRTPSTRKTLKKSALAEEPTTLPVQNENDEKLCELQEAMKALEIKHQKTVETVEEEKTKIDNLAKEKAELEAKLKSTDDVKLQKMVDDLKSEKENLEFLLTAETQKVSELNFEKDVTEEKMDKLMENLSEIKAKNAELITDFESEKTQREKFEQKCSGYAFEVQNLSRQLENKPEDTAATNEQIEKLKEENSKLFKQLDKKDELILMLTKFKTQSQHNLDESKKIISDLKTKNQKISGLLIQMEAKANDKENIAKGALAQIRKNADTIAAQSKQIQGLEIDLKAEFSRTNTLRANSKLLENRLEQKVAREALLCEKKEKLQNRCDSLEKKYKDAKNEIETLKMRNDLLEREKTKTEKSNKVLKNRISYSCDKENKREPEYYRQKDYSKDYHDNFENSRNNGWTKGWSSRIGF